MAKFRPSLIRSDYAKIELPEAFLDFVNWENCFWLRHSLGFITMTSSLHPFKKVRKSLNYMPFSKFLVTNWKSY